MKVAFIDSVHEILEQRLVKSGFSCTDYTQLKRDELKSNLSNFEGIVIRSRIKIDNDFLKCLPKLKFIARSGAGMENIDLDYCLKNNITCFNAPEGNRNAVAEHALGMILSLFNKLNKGDKEIRNGIWDREDNRGIELDGKTIGLIGYGNNGAAFAKKLRGFEVDILAYDKYKSGFSEHNVKESSLEELKEKCDLLSFHIPQNEETIFMFDDAFLNTFQKSFYLINLSRGKIVKSSTLVRGLKSGKILGACLDVLEYEKSSFENMFSDTNISEDFKYILNSSQTLLSPHVGGWTKESYYKLSNVLAKKILDEFKQNK